MSGVIPLFPLYIGVPNMSYAKHNQLAWMMLQHISRGVEMYKQAIILMIAKVHLFGNPS
jgi:hypothetical protein